MCKTWYTFLNIFVLLQGYTSHSFFCIVSRSQCIEQNSGFFKMSLIYNPPSSNKSLTQGGKRRHGLYIGGQKDAKNREKLNKWGITHILNVTPEKEGGVQVSCLWLLNGISGMDFKRSILINSRIYLTAQFLDCFTNGLFDVLNFDGLCLRMFFWFLTNIPSKTIMIFASLSLLSI